MKKLLCSVLLLVATAMSANAYIDSQFMTSEQALINTGNSPEMARTINYLKVNPYSPVEDLDERQWYEKFYHYMDPAKGNEYTFPKHYIKFDSSWRDL